MRSGSCRARRWGKLAGLVLLCAMVVGCQSGQGRAQQPRLSFSVEMDSSNTVWLDQEGESYKGGASKPEVVSKRLRSSVGNSLYYKLGDWDWRSSSADIGFRLHLLRFKFWKRKLDILRFLGGIFVPVPGAAFALGYPVVSGGDYTVTIEVLNCETKNGPLTETLVSSETDTHFSREMVSEAVSEGMLRILRRMAEQSLCGLQPEDVALQASSDKAPQQNDPE